MSISKFALLVGSVLQSDEERRRRSYIEVLNMRDVTVWDDTLSCDLHPLARFKVGEHCPECTSLAVSTLGQYAGLPDHIVQKGSTLWDSLQTIATTPPPRKVRIYPLFLAFTVLLVVLLVGGGVVSVLMWGLNVYR